MTKSSFYKTVALATLLQLLSANANHDPSTAFAFLPRHHHRLQVHQRQQQRQQYPETSPLRPPSPLFSTASVTDEIPSDSTVDHDNNNENASSSLSGDPEAILQSRNRLLALSTTLSRNSPSGKFINRPADKIQLQKAIAALEALTSPSTGNGDYAIFKKKMVGDWNLVVTANLPSSDIRRRIDERREKYSANSNSDNNDDEKKKKTTKGGPLLAFLKKNSRKSRSSLSLSTNNNISNPIQESIRKSINVTQRIRTDYDSSNNEIDRVDNVIEFTPLNKLEDVLSATSTSSSSPLTSALNNLSNLLGNVNINPLQVKQGKLVLIHKAEVESVEPVLRTKIAWVSSVLNIAGTSQFFDPQGSDIFGLNNLFGEFLNVGTFDTLYADDDIRISRTRGPIFEQLRVFLRSNSTILQDEKDLLESLNAEMRVEEEVEVGSSPASKVGNQVKKMTETVGGMGENVRSVMEKDVQSVNTAVNSAMNDVVERVQDVVENDIRELGDAVMELGSEMKEGSRGNITGAIANVTKVVGKVPGDVMAVVEEDAKEVGVAIEGALDSMVKDVQDSVEGDLKVIENSAKNVQEIISSEGGVNDVEKKESSEEEEVESNESSEDEK